MQALFKDIGVYLHVPFCAKSCAYCRFYKRFPTPLDISAYVDGVFAELKFLREENAGSLPKANTFFWGGGTPSILPEREIESLAGLLVDEFGVPDEWTVEVAPTALTSSKLALLKNLGVNRISLGVQSFSERTLESLGRGHSLSAVRSAIANILVADFEKFSIDLIFGAAGQTIDEWLFDIEEASKCGANHISAYCLEGESATSACSGRLDEADYVSREREGDFFEVAMTRLSELGFAQYEISNYAKNGFECRHNLATWNMASWIGLGPSAASQWRGLRRRNPISLEKWLDGIKLGSPNFEDVARLDDAELFLSAVIFGLRMNAGVDLQMLKTRFPSADVKTCMKTVRRLESEGLLSFCDGRVKLTTQGRLLADSVAVEFL